MANYSGEDAGGNVFRAPLFDGERFEYWKDILKSLYISHDPKLWDVVEDGFEAPKDVDGVEISIKDWNIEHKK